MRFRSLCLVAAALAAISGCGESETTPEDEATGTVAVFLEGCAEGDSIAVQDTLTDGLRRQFLRAGEPARGCAAIALPPATAREASPSSFAGSEPAAIAVDAGFGTATVRTPSGEYELELEQSNGQWRISQPPRSPAEVEG
jgi:hypothetical protein